MKAHKTIGGSVFCKALVVLLVLLLSNQGVVMAQNTKGDKSVGNQKQVRETKAKTVKRKKPGKTKDISGRRLRTKNRSSANRANASYPQPDPYRGRPRAVGEKPAKPVSPIVTRTPRTRERAWKGNAAGGAIKRIKPGSAEAARANVFPQSGPNVNNPSSKPRKEKAFGGSTRTASGQPVQRRVPRQKERAWKGNVHGSKVGAASATGKIPNVYPQKNQYSRYVGKSGRKSSRPIYTNSTIRQMSRQSGKPVGGRQKTAPSSSARNSNVYPQINQYSRFSGKDPGRKSKPMYTNSALRQIRRSSGQPLSRPNVAPSASGRSANVYSQKNEYSRYVGTDPGKRKTRVYDNATVKRMARATTQAGRQKARQVASATGSFIQRGRKNVYWGKFKKTEKAVTRDLTGRPVRTKNFRSMPAGLVGRDTLKHFGKKPGGDRPSGARGKVSGFVSRSGTQRAWQGDIAKWKLRRLQPNRNQEKAGIAVYPRKRPGSTSGEPGKPIRGAQPGKGAHAVGKALARTNGKGFQRGFSNQGEGFTGLLKAQRPLKGGGSVSGKLWNNKRAPIDPRIPSGSAQRAGKFAGNIRYQGKVFGDQGEGFSGSLKAKKAPKRGGGTTSGKLWNNKGKAIVRFSATKKASLAASFKGKIRSNEVLGFADQGEGFTGTLKAHRPLKGGGTVSGKLWNNKNTPIDPRVPPSSAQRAGTYSGNIKAHKPLKGGGSVSGKLWNNKEQPIEVISASKDGARASQFAGKKKIRNGYTQNPYAVSESIKKRTPDKTTYSVDGLQVRVKRDGYQTKPYAANNAMKGIGPNKNTVRASEYARGIKMIWSTKHNPNSVKEALDGRKPGKAYARIEDFQGNTKMRKYNKGGLHPDARFAHAYQNNVKEERTILLNVKLIWAKLFEKNETQPVHLRKTERKPRYDNREKGLWND